MSSTDETPLTYKQRVFVKAKIAGKSGVAAAQEAYGTSYTVSNAIAHENINKPSIIFALQKAYEKQGMTIDALVKPLADGLKANKVVAIEGDFFETDVPDHSIRIKAAGMAGMWLGIGRDKDDGNKTINFNITADTHKDKFNL